MRPRAWLAMCVLCLVVAAVALVGAFTRFRDGPGQGLSPEEAEQYNDDMYDRAQWSAGLGVAGAFALLGAFACGQRWRQTSSPPPAKP